MNADAVVQAARAGASWLAPSSLETGRQFFTLALELLADPQGAYRRGNDQVKRALAKLLLARFYLDTERHEAAKTFRGLIEVAQPATNSTDSSGSIPKDGTAAERITEAGLLKS